MSTELIGSPELVEVVAALMFTQVIHVQPMDDDADFSKVVGSVLDTSDPTEVAALHRASSGRMGALIHIARMRGLEPPYALRPDRVVRPPVLPSPGDRRS